MELSVAVHLPAVPPGRTNAFGLPLVFPRSPAVLAELDQLQRAAARAALRRGDDEALARQVVWERLARGALALEGGNVG